MNFELRQWTTVLIGLKKNLNATQIYKQYDINYSHVTNIIKVMRQVNIITEVRKVGREIHYVLHPQAYSLAKHLICVKSIMETNKWI